MSDPNSILAENSSRNTTLIIIMILLTIIVIIIICNYWFMYSSMPCRSHVNTLAHEGYANNSSNTLTPNRIIQNNINSSCASSQNLCNIQNKNNASGNVTNPLPIQQPAQEKPQQYIKSNVPESGVVKLIIYHMQGCGHCTDIMKNKQPNGKTKFEQLCEIFKNNNNVQILDYQSGRDKEAGSFSYFPVIHIVTESGPTEYNGSRDVGSISQAVAQAAQSIKK